MKTILLYFLCILPFSFSFALERPKVCLNMIVKNEAHVIERCLNSLKPLIDYWVIVDTGSTDGTQDVIQECMKEIPGKLYERPWINFAYNRNEALQLAKEEAEYLIFIDADDYLEFDPGFTRPLLFHDCYSLPIHYSGTLYSRVQLIRTDLQWEWIGPVHEVITSQEAAPALPLEGVRMVIVGGGGRSYDPDRFLKDAALLEKALEEDPYSTRNMFYLAQSYRDAQELELAIETYEKRVSMGGWDEEVFYSLYQIGILHQRLEHSQEEIMRSYSRAFQYRPIRIEPLFRLSSYFRTKQDYLLGYVIAKLGLDAPMPNDLLFIEKWVYDYALLLEYSICAYWIGKYEEALDANQKLLAKVDLPPHVRECVERNLGFVIEKLPAQFWINQFIKNHNPYANQSH